MADESASRAWPVLGQKSETRRTLPFPHSAPEIGEDEPLPCAQRVSFTRRDPPPKAAAQALASWSQEDWVAAIVASPTMFDLATRAGTSWETVRIHLLRTGLLKKHGRYHVLRDDLLRRRNVGEAWAAA